MKRTEIVACICIVAVYITGRHRGLFPSSEGFVGHCEFVINILSFCLSETRMSVI